MIQQILDGLDAGNVLILVNNLVLITTTLLGSISLMIASKIGDDYDKITVRITHRIFFAAALAVTFFTLNSVQVFQFKSLSAIIGDIAFIYVSFLVIERAGAHSRHWFLKCLKRYDLLVLACLSGFFIGIEQSSWGSRTRIAITIALLELGFLLAFALYLKRWQTLNIGQKQIGLSLGYLPAATIALSFIANPYATAYVTSTYILIILLPTLLGLLIGTLLAMAIQMNQNLENSSMTDWLTGLYNRRFFFARAPKLVELAVRQQKTSCILMIDIDDFKKVNDSHGHHIGDQVLKFVAKVLRTTIRTSDIALRFGGEEFVIFMPIEQLSGAANLAERLRLLVEQGDCNLPDVSISIGVHEMSNGETLEHALKQSDNRLYQAKHAGKNKVAVDNEPLQSIPS